MKTCIKTSQLLLLVILIAFNACKPKENSNKYLGVEVSKIETELNSLLNCYYPRVIDTINGGFYTNFEYNWKLSDKQEKMLVTQSRYIWTASIASSIFPENKIFRSAADHGYQFLTQKMWDKKRGGFFLNYHSNIDSIEKQEYKLVYGNAFALYALAEYAKINKSKEVIDWINKTLEWMENNAHDSVFKGYHNLILAKKEKHPKQEANEMIKRAGWGDPSGKDQNSSIHILEALTNVYQVMPTENVKQRLSEMLHLVRDTMVTKDGYLNLYFKKDWTAISNRDSSEKYIRANIFADHISFGHNIETAYLIIDASKTLYGKPDSASLSIAKKLVDHTLENGFDKDYYGLLDKGYLFKGKSKIEIVDSTKVWWSQAEALHSLALMSSYYPNESKYKDAFYKMWQYIEKEMIDHENGGWYASGIDKTPSSKLAPKAHAWKGNYHDGRALMMIYEYSKKN